MFACTRITHETVNHGVSPNAKSLFLSRHLQPMVQLYLNNVNFNHIVWFYRFIFAIRCTCLFYHYFCLRLEYLKYFYWSCYWHWIDVKNKPMDRTYAKRKKHKHKKISRHYPINQHKIARTHIIWSENVSSKFPSFDRTLNLCACKRFA